MGRLSMDLAPNTEKTEPKPRTLRRQSTGSLTIQITEPHYLRASTGSCHDFCKYGMKREYSPDHKPWSPIVRRKAASTSPKLMPLSSRQQVNELLKPKPLKPNAVVNHKSSPRQANHASTSSGKTRESQNHDVKPSNIKTLTRNRPSLPLSSPKARTAPKKASQPEIKRRVERNEMKKTCSLDNVPEKIIHVVKPENESRNESPTTLSPKHNQQLNLEAEKDKKTTRGERVIIEEEKELSTPEKLILESVNIDETENGNAACSKDVRLKRPVSDGKIIIRKNEDLKLVKSVVEEKASSSQFRLKKGTVEALVRAFETGIIEARDS